MGSGRARRCRESSGAGRAGLLSRARHHPATGGRRKRRSRWTLRVRSRPGPHRHVRELKEVRACFGGQHGGEEPSSPRGEHEAEHHSGGGPLRHAEGTGEEFPQRVAGPSVPDSSRTSAGPAGPSKRVKAARRGLATASLAIIRDSLWVATASSARSPRRGRAPRRPRARASVSSAATVAPSGA